MISHRNIIANVIQFTSYEEKYRQSITPAGKPLYTDVSLGLLPQSHIFALVAICHTGIYRGDQIVVLPKFEMKSYLESIQNFKISCLFVVCTVLDATREEANSRRFPQSSSTCSGTRTSAPSLI